MIIGSFPLLPDRRWSFCGAQHQARQNRFRKPVHSRGAIQAFRLEGRIDCCSAENPDSLAPQGLQDILEMEIENGQALHSGRTPKVDSPDGPGKPFVGGRADCE